MNVFRQMAFAAFDYQPGDRQRPFAIQQTDHQGNAALSNFAAIDDEHQLADGCQPVEQFLHKGQVIGFILNPFILDPAAVTFDPAVCLGVIRCFASDGWQLATLTQHNATHQRCQCGQHACGIPFRFAWILEWSEKSGHKKCPDRVD